MSTFTIVNNINTTLAAAITTTSQTTIQLASATGLPSLSGGAIMALTLNDAATQSYFEILYVTAISGSTLTVERGQEGTAARTWLLGDYAYSAATAGVLNTYLQIASTATQTPSIVGSLTVTANAATAIPALLVGATGQSVDMLIVQPTSGTTTFAIDYAGHLQLLNAGGGDYTQIAGTGTTIAGISAAALGFSDSANGALAAFDRSGNMAVSSNLVATNSVAAGNAYVPTNGSVGSNTGSNTGKFFFGNSSSNYAEMDFNATTSVQITLQKVISGTLTYCAVTGGTYTNSSDASFKTNIVPVTGALATIAGLAPSTFTWTDTNLPDIGFIANAAQSIVPNLVRVDQNGKCGLVYTGITTLNTAAIQEIVALLHTAGVAGF